MHGSVHTPPYSPVDVDAHNMNSPRNKLVSAAAAGAPMPIDPRGAEMRPAAAPPAYKRVNSLEFEARVAPFLHAHRERDLGPPPRASPTHRELELAAAAHAHHAAVAAYHHAQQQEMFHRDLPSLSPPPRRDFELISDDGLRSTPSPHQNVHTPTHAAAAAAAALAAAGHGHPMTRARASTPPIGRSGGFHRAPVRSPPAVGDGPIERLGDELLVAASAAVAAGGARHAHHRAASAAASLGGVGVASPAAKRSVFDDPAPLASQHFQDNYLRPKSSSVDGALPPLSEFSAMRVSEEPLPDMETRAAASSLSHLRAPATHAASKLHTRGGGIQHQRAQSHGLMGTQLQGLRLRPKGRAAEAPARVSSEGNASGDDGRPPLPPSASSKDGLVGGLVAHKRRKRGRRPSAQAQREKRETKRSVYLSPLPAGASFETVRELLNDFGGLQTVEFIEDGKSCYARFESYPQADRAVEAGTVGDGVVVMPKKLRVEEVKELQESLAELDAQKKLLQERLGPLGAGAAGTDGALATTGGLSSTSGVARANALRESGRGHQRHASNPTGTRFGGAANGGGGSGHHRFSSNPPIGVQALSAGKALRHGGAKGGGGSSSRKSSVHGSGSGGRRGDRSGTNSRRSSTSGGGNKGGANGGSGTAAGSGASDRPSKYGTNSRRSSLTSEQLEGSWRGGGGGGSAHRRAYSDMNPLNAPQRGSSRFGGPGPSHSNSLAAPSAGAYQPPQVAAKQTSAQAASKKFPVAQAASAAGTVNAADSKPSGEDVANGVSITVTGPQRVRGDSALTLSPPGGPAASRVIVNGPSAHGTGLAAVSVASRPGSRRGSLAAVVKTAKGPDGTKGFNWKQSNAAATAAAK